MAKFKVGQMVEDFDRGEGTVIQVDESEKYCVSVEFKKDLKDEYTITGARWEGNKDVLRLTGRPFNIGDRVVIGGEKGVIDRVIDAEKTPVRVDMGVDSVWLTTDGRAWPGTPIIAEHDLEEESDSDMGKNETENHAAGAIEYRERNKGFDISPGFTKDWPIDNGLDDITVSPEEVRHIAEIQDIDELEYRKMPKYIKMALALEGIEVDLKTADLIREIVDSVNAHGGQYDLDTSCNIRQKIEEKYV